MRCLALVASLAIRGDAVVGAGSISTSAAEVRVAYSPDGRRVLWGSIGRDGPDDQQDIWETHREGARWSKPARVSFDTTATEFDPVFSPDGRKLYFQSDRTGGFGGSDIYVVVIDRRTGRFGAPVNLGPSVNSAGNEWAATPTTAGIIFSSDGWGGLGKHDLLITDIRHAESRPRNLGHLVNGPLDELDAAVTPDGQTLIFSSGDMEAERAEVRLYISRRTATGWSPRRRLDVGCSTFVLGAAFDHRRPGILSYGANCPGGLGRMDIHEAPFRLRLSGT